MKILLLCWRDTAHPQGGGSERYLERVGAYLARHGHEVVYRTAAYPGAARREVRDGMTFSRAGGRYTVYVRAAAAMLAGRLGLGPLKGVDAVVDTQNGIPFFARVFAGRPTVLLTHHCHRAQWPVAGPVIGRLGWWLESRLAPRVYRGAPYVTVSASSRGQLVELGVDPGRIRIVANGIDPLEISDAAPAPAPAPGAPVRVVTLSRLVPHKRIEHAMAAVAELPGVVLDVIGSGWWGPRLREHARDLGVEDRVVFHGQVDEATKHRILAGAALHLMPSAAEGWGLAVVEAAQHGVPTVGYAASGGLRDSIDDGRTGVLVEPDDPRAFTAAVRSLLDDVAVRAAMGERARAWAAGFSWADTGAAFEGLLTEIAR